jgi:hypothetical protein
MRKLGPKSDDDPETLSIQRLAIQAIGKIKAPGAVKFLLEQLDNPGGSNIADCLSALGETGKAAQVVPKLMRLVADDRKVADLGAGMGQKFVGAGVVIGQARIQVNSQDVSRAEASQLTVGDVALSAVLVLTNQNPATYGMQDLPATANVVRFAGENPLQGLEAKCFKDDKAREEGIKKIREWYETWPQKPKQ